MIETLSLSKTTLMLALSGMLVEYVPENKTDGDVSWTYGRRETLKAPFESLRTYPLLGAVYQLTELTKALT